jgi:hypothetical protein
MTQPLPFPHKICHKNSNEKDHVGNVKRWKNSTRAQDGNGLAKLMEVMWGKKNYTSHFSCKGTPNAVLMVTVNVNYKFLLTDVGKTGRDSGGCVFSNTKSYQLFTKKVKPFKARKSFNQ